MDVVNNIRGYLASWSRGGESECRTSLFAPHCNPSDPSCMDTLTTVYHTLLCSALQTWSPKHTLSPSAFVEFVQSVLDSLPSSSSESPTASSNAAIFGETLVDMIWSVDAELDEVLSDARAALATYGKQEVNGTVSSLVLKAKKAEQNAEKDKETVQVIVKRLLELKIIDPHLCRERLDTAILASVDLIPDKVALEKKEVRMRTGLFYKQNKFNLLREQSEGYSKLTTELTSSLGPSHSPLTGRPTESYTSIEERARPVWEKVISLIGYFDLDPNRALDIILDIFTVHLATHYTFFIALLSFSPWAGSYRRPDLGAMGAALPPGSFTGKTLDEVLTLANPRRQEAEPTPSDGNPRVLAQVLGFKFAYYQSPDVAEATPKSLYLTAAILIREGFISLEDLYPHIAPDDSAMESVRQEYLDDVKSRIAGAKVSQLAMAAPLESATSAQSRAKAATPVDVKKAAEPKDNQKIGLLTALLAVGDLKPAFAILSKFPFLVDARPEIADLLIRIMKVSLAPLYESLMVTKERNPSFTQPRPRYGTSGVLIPPTRKPLLTLWAPTPPSTITTEFVFFFPDWIQQVPICTVLSDLEDVIEPLMSFVGVHISRDPLFLTKFLRLGRSHLQSTMPIDPATKKPVGEPDPENPIRQFWFKVLRVYLLPALPLIRGNAVCTVEVWNIIRQYSTTSRWRLYGEWKTNVYKSHPELEVRFVQIDRESKGILRRLSHHTIDSLSGTVAKMAHSNPCIFFANAVHQIMAYDNLANVVIQALRYVTNMGFDVLVYVILDALSNPHKQRLKDDGVNTADWLQSLASFTGMLFRRYSADLTPVLTYVMHQLHNGQTTELVVLRELIWKMAGIEPLPSLSDAQVSAMAGGPVLRIESVASATRGARLDPGDAVLKGPQRLGRALLESSLALNLLIQVAQQRQACVFKAPDAHIKSLASLYDTTHGVLLQYLELLTSPSVIPLKDYATKVLPSLGDLGVIYGISAPICMQIIRPVLQTSLLSSALAMQEQERIANEEAEKRLKAALTAKREPIVSRVASPSFGTPSAPEVAVETKPRIEEQPSQEDVAMEVEQSVSIPPAESPWVPELEALFDDIKKIAPGNAYEVIGPGFYVTFWQLSTYDLSPPAAKYDEEGTALMALSRQEDAKYMAADRSSDRAKRATAPSHRARRDRYLNTAMALTQEFKDQTASRAFTMKRLAREKAHWFSHGPKAVPLVESIIEHCIQPRCLLSPMDADFCVQFIKILHTQGTPGFHTLNCYDKLLGDHVKVVLFSCSEYEAHNYGRFLAGILSDLFKWHNDEQLYLADNRTKIGGKTVYHPGMQRAPSKTNGSDTLLDWPIFQRILRKWHKKLAKCFTDCIQTGEFMHVYNAIIVMKELLPVFPLSAVTDTGAAIDAAMDRFLENEDRGDLKILGRAYSAGLKKREALWTMPKKPPPAAAAAIPPPKSTTPTQPAEKPRTVVPPSGPSSQTIPTGDGRRPATPAATAPSAPRAQLVANTGPSAGEKPPVSGISSAKLAMDSIPRPEVVKRVRPDKLSQSPKPPGEASPSQIDAVKSSVPPHMNELRVAAKDEPPAAQPPRSRYGSPAPARDSPMPQDIPLSGVGKDQPYSPRLARLEEDRPRPDGLPAMPPPVVPSQTASAQELRETAKQSIRIDKFETVRTAGGSNAPSPRRRSLSPTSRPGTRSHSAESRASGGRSRSDRVTVEVEREERRVERDRQDSRDHATTLSRRDSITHTRSERRERTSTRDSDKDADRDRERDRGRDRHGDREKDRERDRDSDRVRDRDRDRERDRDRHRRDDKDRDRESRKERDLIRGQPGAPTPPDERALPTRPDPRHRPAPADDGLGKRRRPIDDEPDRSSKRSSRKDVHRDDRSRRPPDKESHERKSESERRRKERDESGDVESRLPAIPADKVGDKRIPPEGLPPSSSSAKVLPPSAPRAMSTGDMNRSVKGEPIPARDRHRDYHPSNGPAPGPSSMPYPDPASQGLGSLQSRIGAKEPPRSLPQTGTSYRPESQRKEDDRESRKRTVSDRDKDVVEPVPSPPGELNQVPKRPRINRTRYNNTAPNVAKKLGLPIDPSAGDRVPRRRD
ncbi:putative THO complex subunit 2 N-terminus [Lyophyllum shimeji]|uniref:THO complex subunit 2 n=1 Tax=Lyophyllum shimeji TaxID=47721 RepID=A0A9P3PCT7_LYOSH|nr:putative THO complex subunit 2 N-terminus [Lyophyllum shimeji]